VASRLEVVIGEVADALATLTGLDAAKLSLFGDHDAAARAVPHLVTWVPLAIDPRDAARQEDSSDTVVYTKVERCTVTLEAPKAAAGQTDYQVLEALYDAFLAALASCAGESVVEVGQATHAPERRHVNAGLACSMTVGIRFPVYVEQLDTHTVLTTAIDAAVVDPDWDNREQAP
jgi:hypothetical protein